jgi:L-lactate permease
MYTQHFDPVGDSLGLSTIFAVGMAGQEGDLFRTVFTWSVLLVLILCVLVVLQSTSVLSWMVP